VWALQRRAEAGTATAIRHRRTIGEETAGMIKLRLRRVGAKKRPAYRIVVADARSKRDGRFIESVGFYDPLTEPTTIRIDGERARYWLGVGAQPTDRVAKLLRIQGVTDESGNVVAASADVAEAVVGEPAPTS
jgi:small subunit ribosomal protein S16